MFRYDEDVADDPSSHTIENLALDPSCLVAVATDVDYVVGGIVIEKEFDVSVGRDGEEFCHLCHKY